LGVWDLSIAAMTSRIVFRPQVQSVIVKTSKSERTVAFADRARLRALGARLRRDMAYRANSLAFFVAAVDRMIDAEAEHRIRFPLLDEAIDSRERFKERMATRSGVLPLLRGDKKKPGKAGWLGVEVPCFVQCMEDCEEDHDFWEVWVHAYCLAKCAIKCGTGGGALFPD
jgi:hypothetical protein